MEKEIPQSPRIKEEPTWQDLVPPPRARKLRTSLRESTAPVDAYQLAEDSYKQTLEWGAPSEEPLTFIYDPYSLENIEDLRSYLDKVQDLLWEWERAKGLKHSDKPIKKLFRALCKNITELKELLDKQERTLTNFNQAEGAEEEVFAQKLEGKIPEVVEKMEEIGQQYNSFLAVDEAEEDNVLSVPEDTPDVEAVQQTEDIDIVEFDLYKGMGLDSARAHVRELYFAEVITPYEKYNGVWPTAECEKLHEDISALQFQILSDLELQETFILGSSLQDKKQDIEEKNWEYGVMLDALTDLMNQAIQDGWDGGSVVARGPENNADVLNAREFEDFKQRIHRRQKDIDAALKYFESHTIAPEHRHYLDELTAERKAITDIVVDGLEGAKSQDPAAPKVYSAELVTRAEPHFSSINDVMRALDDLYSPKVAPADDAAAGKEENKTEVVLTELRVLSPAEEMKLLEAFFMRRMNGSDEAEKMAQVRRGLRELPLEEWREALQQARSEYSEEELEQLLGPVAPVAAAPTPAPPSSPFPIPGIKDWSGSPGVVAAITAKYAGAPQPTASPAEPKALEAVLATPERTPTPEEQAARAKWLTARKKLLFSKAADGAEATSKNGYEDPTAEEMFSSLQEDTKYFLASQGMWRFGKFDGVGNAVLCDQSDPLTFMNRYSESTTTEEQNAIFDEQRTAKNALTSELQNTFAREYFTYLDDRQLLVFYEDQEQQGTLNLSDEQKQLLVERYAMDRLNEKGERANFDEPSLNELYSAAATEEDKQAILAVRDKALASYDSRERTQAIVSELTALSPDQRAKLFTGESEESSETPLQNKYQNELAAHYESLKTEGSGFQRFGRRIAATFGFKPELPPELDATREAMFDATADYTKETREMLRLRKEAGKTAGEKLSRRYSESRQKQLLEEYVLEKSGTYDTAGNFTSLKFLYDQASTDEERSIILAKRDEDLTKLTDEQKNGLLQQKTEALIQRRYEKMLGRSVLMGTFERQLEAQRQVTEDLAFQAPEVLKKHKRKISLFAAGAIGGITGGASSAVMGVTRALAGGLLGASIGGFVGEKWKNRIERETEKGTGAVLDSLAQRLSKDSITATELEDTYQELKKIYEKADSQTRTRIAGLMAMALAIGLATGQALEFGAESMGLVDTPDVGGSAEVTGSGEVPAGGATDSGSDTASDGAGGTEGGEAASGEKLGAASDGTTSPEAGQTAGGGAEGNNGATAEAPKPYTAERGDNMWDILEGQTHAGKLPAMEGVANDDGLIDLVRDKLNADADLRHDIGFGDSADQLQEGAKVDLAKLNEVAQDINEHGYHPETSGAEAAAADTTPDAAPAESVDTAQADASDASAGPEKTVTADALPEQSIPQSTEGAVENAIATAEKAADNVKEVVAPDGTSFTFSRDEVSPDSADQAAVVREGPTAEGTRIESLKGADQVKAYAADYEGGALRFVSQEVQPFVEQTEGVASNGFFGLFKTPPPPSMGGYALFQHVPLREMAELNGLPDEQLLATLTEKYHVENPEQFSVWIEKLNDMQSRGVFDLNKTPDLALADAVALDVINSKSTNV